MTLNNTKSEPAQTAGNAPERELRTRIALKYGSSKGVLLSVQEVKTLYGLLSPIPVTSDVALAHSAYLSRVVASSQEAAPPGFDEATEKRWQDAIYEVCKKAVGAQNDSLIDGGGTDSGDALDFTLTEIGQAFAFLEEKHAEPAPSPATKETPPTLNDLLLEANEAWQNGSKVSEILPWLAKMAFDAGAKSVVAAPQLTREEFETAASRLERFKYDFRRAMVRGEPTGEYLEPSTFNAWTGWQLAKSAWAGAAPQPKELAELLKRLMATNIKGAMLQLDDHFAGDERLVDTIRSLKRQLESALAGAAALPSVQKEWISVEERLPDAYPNVLFVRQGEVVYGRWTGRAWEDLTDTYDDEPETVKTDVKHWQPLPSPPVPPVQTKEDK